jgi:uncharacterized membrane protein
MSEIQIEAGGSTDDDLSRGSNGNGLTQTRVEQRVRQLGWFSIGLGLAQLVAPGRVSRAIGLGDGRRNRSTMFTVGVREMAAGVGILSRQHPTGWLWMRVLGDVMDLALLQSAARSRGAKKLRIGAAMAGVIGVSILDVFTSRQLRRLAARGEEVAVGRPVRIVKSITVNQPPEEVYRFWRNLENLPRFMSNVEAVQVFDARLSHWRVKGPAGQTVEWDAEITDDRENQLIAWRSLESSDVRNRGMVWFRRAPGTRGTEIRLELEYDPPGGRLGATVAKLFGREPGQQADADLRRFKQVMEVGEVVQSDASLYRRPHPARPPERPVGTGEGGA